VSSATSEPDGRARHLTASRTGEVHQTTGVAVANTGVVGGNLTVDVAVVSEAFWTETFPLLGHEPVEPLRRGLSGLLAAGSRVVPFVGRTDELARLTDWRDGPGELSVLLVHAPGGQGKTRLAAAFAERSAKDGWAVAQARHNTDPRPPAPEVGRVVGRHGLLVVVDYAERWPRVDLERLFQSQFLRQGGPARVLLLARPADYWWKSLANPLFKLNAAVDELPLGPLADSVVERQIAFIGARDRFGEVLGATQVSQLRPAGSLADDAYGLVLTLHMAALVAVDAHVRGATAPTDPVELSAYLLDREYDHWQTMRDNDRVSLSPASMARLVGLATLTRPLPTTVAADTVVTVGLADGVADALTLLGEHAACYPPTTPGTSLEPLFPDRLGEDFLARLLPGATGHGDGWATTLPAQLLLPADDGPQASAALAVLVETGHRWPHVGRDHLFPLLRENPRLIVDAGGSSLVTLATYAPPELLERLDSQLPERDRHIDLDAGMAALTRRLTEHGLATAEDDATRAVLYMKLGLRADNAGLHEEAATSEREAIAAYRRLAAADPSRYESDLANALNNLSASLSEMGQRRDALVHIEEAAAIRRRLADAAPAAYLADLAAALNNLGNIRAHLGDHEQALAATEESVTAYRTLADSDPTAYEPDLARSLNNYGRDLSRLGRSADALVARQDAVTIRRRLTTANPAAHLPALATSLHSLGLGLSEVGRDEEALVATREAVAIRRQLVATAPATHAADLADSLTSLGARLMRREQYREALGIMREAVDIRRPLAEANPAAVLPGFAASLHGLSICLKELGEFEEATTVAGESVGIRRRLVAATPAAYRPHLAQSLYSFAVCLRYVGDYEQALSVGQEAVDMYRGLAESGLTTFLASLARALRHIGICLSHPGPTIEGVSYQEEAVTIFRRLAAAEPAKFEPTLSKSLQILGYNLSKLNEYGKALSAGREAVEIQQRLATADPERHEPGLASSLDSLADIRLALGQHEETLTTRRSAVALWLRLASVNPRTHEFHLASSLMALSSELSELSQRHEEALAVGEKVVAIWRRLADADPDGQGTWLAQACGNVAIFRQRLDRYADARDAAAEAVTNWRRLVDADPTVAPELATALHLLGRILAELNEDEQAIDVEREVIEIRSRLAADEPDAYEPSLATSLALLAKCLANVGDHEAALDADQKALAIRRRLADLDPTTHQPALARSLRFVGLALSDLHRYAEALAAVSEAIEIHQWHAADPPGTTTDELVYELTTKADILDALGRHDEANQIRSNLHSPRSG
jgi:tetratricopeptide (TPR) repeat protein